MTLRHYKIFLAVCYIRVYAMKVRENKPYDFAAL